MQQEMVTEAIRVASEAMKKHEIQTEIAKHIKQHFDAKYQYIFLLQKSPNWHCIVGKSFATVLTY